VGNGVAEKQQGDEALELLWYARESGEQASEAELAADGAKEGLATLAAEGYVEEASPGRYRLTPRGEERASRLVRSHRLAERLVHDVLGEAYEQGACEFEHIITPSVVDAICTLLGHPRECPHGMAIPPGACCRAHADTVGASVVPLDRLSVGQSARVAYVYGETDRQLHKLENLRIRPGVEVKLHQRAPSLVIECGSSTIALDERVAANIHVWVPPDARLTARDGTRGAPPPDAIEPPQVGRRDAGRRDQHRHRRTP
jgi:DtxR family transcriptional regulator, Mn-dependent transcriptional regulator